MKCTYACQSEQHTIARRSFLGGLLAGGTLAAGLNWSRSALAEQLERQQKRVLVFFMDGGLSQLESWDPKPGTDTGGPFRPISTSVPGIQISELLPYTAQQMHHLALVRSVNTRQDDHGLGRYQMTTGRRQTPVIHYPHLGSVAARLLAPEDSPLPGFIRITPGGGGIDANDAAYLGPKYASVSLGNGQPPQNIDRPEGATAEADQRRTDVLHKLNARFAARRRTAQTEAYTNSYDQAARLMERRELFDVTKEPAADLDRYGTYDLGRHCLLARRLLENGVSFVQVSHSNYDTHFENFDFHIEQLGEWDRPFATLLADLADRGLLESTLVVVMAEFGRTPKINTHYGRDHWGSAWSVALAGSGLQKGAVIGKTNDNGTAVADREVDHGHLFHTYIRALGLDPTATFDVAGRPMPIADPAYAAIEELLA